MTHDTTTQEYIEVIRDLENENKVARVKDIADRRGVSRSSVSIILNQLLDKDLIAHEQYGHVSLSRKGRRLANDLERRHQAIKEFLVKVLGVSEENAEKDACKFEHDISKETFTAFSRFLSFVENCPKNFKSILNFFRNCGKYGSGERDCLDCPDAE
ncbi:MAG: metal-dependent transcriptional regulator [Calditrichaeota bacterium]|nr:metal-dependent transcriptional regulator [Calditrichota bacterium]